MTPLSFSQKQWKQAPKLRNTAELFDLLLKSRDLLNESDIQHFLHPQLSDLHNPYLMSDMERVVHRIYKAIQSNERIMIYGDFDTDGITSTVILVQALRDLGGIVSYRIPSRNNDSHGLKTYLIEEIVSKNVTLLITCDCGINDEKELDFARNIGLDVIVTDHHHPHPGLSRNAYAFLNPLFNNDLYPDKDLSGSGVAFKLVQALFENASSPQKDLDWLLKFLEIAAVGLIADCVPLHGESRIMAKLGLEKMKNTAWRGLSQLFNTLSLDMRTLDEQTIGFYLAPRLNAASRVGDVSFAVQLFLGDEVRHDQRIQQLEVFNDHRKNLTQLAFSQSLLQIRSNASFQMFHHESWVPGILGLVASRHSEQLSVPVVACTIREDGRIGASCRAPQGFSMIGALQSCAHLFDHFGGHEGAAGFIAPSSQFDSIRLALDEYFLSQCAFDFSVDCLAYVSPSLLCLEVVDILRDFGPFGIGNPEPLFGISNATVIQFDIIGKTKNHLKITFQVEGRLFTAISFFAETFISQIQLHQRVDFLCTLSDSYWNNQRRLEIRIQDIRVSMG